MSDFISKLGEFIVSVQDELGRSLEFLLQRMGITVESCLDGEKLYTDVDFFVEISLADGRWRCTQAH